ncbi:MAG: DEAD/DEAH box helicase, partial [Gammaproteobacteria bacterium]|nr:DEAD/DEAH box helicase [Gammaproteobacteria bacterium]
MKKVRKLKKPKKEKLNLITWNTTDAEEIERRRLRAQSEKFKVLNKYPKEKYFSSFSVTSKNNKQYHVEIRSLQDHINSCDCQDYQSNQLGTCKHIENVLLRLKKFGKKIFKKTGIDGCSFIDIYFDPRDLLLHIQWPKIFNKKIRNEIDFLFSEDSALIGNPISAYGTLKNLYGDNEKIFKKHVRLSNHIDYFIDYQKQIAGRQSTKENFLRDVSAGKKTLKIMKHDLYEYQQDGMMHLAFNERALLADEMGLGKTVQAIAACELLRRDKKVKRVLVVATASLKSEWEEQITKFTSLNALVIQGARADRLKSYQKESFFYLCNYEQVVMDYADMQRLLSPDVIILDEAQRIKNWQTKTAAAIKQLKSRYAFVLTGTPIENRIDDIYSIIQFLDPHIFGSLFRFNRDFYMLDDKGKSTGYKNLDLLHQRVRSVMLRRLKSDVEGQLPKRTVNNYFVKMDDEQRTRYAEFEKKVSSLMKAAQSRPLRKEEFERLQRYLSCMRMLCDTTYILDQTCRISPKINELTSILDECLSDPTAKIIIFSEWERMLQLVCELAVQNNIVFSWHTGSVAQHKRREEINRFKNDPACRLFLSTDSGSVGLNLQAANIVINLDLPWNPAKLEQRIAR